MRPGDQLELFAHVSLAETFFHPFVFPSPQLSAGKELIDSVAYFRNSLLLVEAKAKEKEPFYESQPAEERWARKKLNKAQRQLQGAHRALSDGRVTQLDSPLRGTVQLKPLSEIDCYGLIILGHHAAPYRPCALNPQLRGSGFPIHVFSARDFGELLRRLTTPVDFLNYLYTRALVHEALNTPVHSEKTFFEFYAANFENLVHTETGRRIYVERYLEPQGRLLRQGSCQDYRYGDVIDNVLRLCATSLRQGSASQAACGIKADPDALVAVMEEMGQYSRLHRITIGKRLHSLMADAANGECWAYWSTCSFSAKRVTVFLVMKECGQERHEFLELLTYVALARWHERGVRLGLGIAIDPANAPSRTYEFVLRRPDWSEETVRKIAASYLMALG